MTWNSSMYLSLYGRNRNKKFSDFYSTYELFETDYNLYKTNCGFDAGLTTSITPSIKLVYYLLAARYANSTIASSDENRFKLELFSKIYQFAPYWAKRIDIQTNLRNLTSSEIAEGSVMINNHAYNPSQSPSTDNFAPLPYINEQNQTKYKKGILDSYAMLIQLLNRDPTEEFLKKFEKLFLTIVEPELPLWYATELSDNDDDSNQ